MNDDRGSTDDSRPPAGVSGEPPGGREPAPGPRGIIVADGGDQIDRVLEALAARRRRYVLYYLREETHAELEEVTAQVAAWEIGKPPAEVSAQVRRTVRNDLYHTHLPKLRNAGIVGFDRRQCSVCVRSPWWFVDDVLEHCASVEAPPAVE